MGRNNFQQMKKEKIAETVYNWIQLSKSNWDSTHFFQQDQIPNIKLQFSTFFLQDQIPNVKLQFNFPQIYV